MEARMYDQTPDLFYEVASIDYPIIDADAHVNEPPDLWQSRVPKKWKARAPKVVKGEDGGDLWSFDDGVRIRPVGLTAVAGMSYPQFRATGQTYEAMRPGSFDTKSRLVDMDIDGIYAQVLYPSVTLTGAQTYTNERELQKVCVRAYNEWLLEFTDGSGGRLVPLAIIPTTGIDDAIKELEWAAAHGHKGIVISAWPNGGLEPSPEDEPFWIAAADRNLPVSVHIGSFLPMPAGRGPAMDTLAFCGKAGNTKAGGNTLPVACDLLFANVFNRHPDVKCVLVEANIGWIPTMLEQVDDMYLRYRFFTNAIEQMGDLMPSRLFHESFWATFMIDTVGMRLRYALNIDQIMWSTDYPHTGCDWPNSRQVIERVFRGLPKDEVKKFLHDNCKALYGLDHVPAKLSELRARA
jgi:predicted TIM-barrel fold metal-dependent hydrolase